MSCPHRFLVASACIGTLLLPACSRSGAGSSSAPAAGAALRLVATSLPEGATWEVNRPIELDFDQPVDVSTVSANSIRVFEVGGAPAAGTFSVAHGGHTVVFQPRCPTDESLDDAGLRVGGTRYVLELRGTDHGGVDVLRAASGSMLAETTRVAFSTPATSEPTLALHDPRFGPPQPVIRAAGSNDRRGSRFVFGDDRARTVFLEFDRATQTYGLSDPRARAPRNLFSDDATRVALLLEFDQPVGPGARNLGRIQWEHENERGAWLPLETRRELLANCDGAALVRVEPSGILPSGRRVRVVIHAGFEDPSGDTQHVDLDDFAILTTEATHFESLRTPQVLADELREDFDLAGRGSFRGTTARGELDAQWGDGVLRSAGEFGCSGGPGGDFDWIVRANEFFVFDTTSAAIVGGPGGVPTTVQNTTGGRVEVRNLTIEEGGQLRVQGPNPMRICASGEVAIRGTVILNGFPGKDVATLNTGHIPEPGGAGGPGGGSGGSSSDNTTGSTPRGGTGMGPHGSADGGQGGESGFAAETLGKDARRPGGGGGGRFASDVDPTSEGLFAAAGTDGHALSTGAESGLSPAAGGAAGVGPFVDGDESNDFLGVRVQAGARATPIRGELRSLQGGYGGGGGGDAVPSSVFPQPNWNVGSDQKGGPGGGGGGALRVRALGRIVFGHRGEILARGGRGATGENTYFLDHVGGTGGSGSGGLVLLESPTQVDFTDGDPANAPIREYITTRGALGRVGPKSATVPPIPCGVSDGGAGGPGIVQVSVPLVGQRPSFTDPSATLVLPTAAMSSADPLADVTTPALLTTLPGFDARSSAQSRWIHTGAVDELSFLFGGVATRGADDGLITTDPNGRVAPLAPLLRVTVADEGVAVERDDMTLRLAGPALAPLRANGRDLYLRTPALLQSFRLAVTRSDSRAKRRAVFDVAAASYDDGAATLTLSLAHARGGQTLRAALGDAQDADIELIPNFFRVSSGGVPDWIAPNSAVRIQFQATTSGAHGRPDEAAAVDWTADTGELTRAAAGLPLEWFRFRVELDRGGPWGPPLELDYLRLPFSF